MNKLLGRARKPTAFCLCNFPYPVNTTSLKAPSHSNLPSTVAVILRQLLLYLCATGQYPPTLQALADYVFGILKYISSLFSEVSLDFRPISQTFCRSLRLIWAFFAVMCNLHVNFLSSIRPRYFTSFLLVIVLRILLNMDSRFSGL